jgi:putative oxidoreductase
MALHLPEILATGFVVVGRVLLGALFVVGGLSHFGELARISGAMGERGVPFPRATLLVGTLWQIAFGALLTVGMLTTVAALALAAFVIAATVMMLNFWDLPHGQQREGAYRAFQTNIAVLGGLLIAAT